VTQASEFANTGGQASSSYGRFHYENWGDAGHRLTVSGLTSAASGTHLFQVEYGNGAGATSTGITCAVKRLRVTDALDGTLVGEGALIMPHLGSWPRWDYSNFVSAQLTAGRSYTVTIESDPVYTNMSAFAHFASYTGGTGGSDGEFNRVNIAALRVLER
jgi:hypothetical protein